MLKHSRAETMEKMKCSEDQYAELMSELCTDASCMLIRLAHDEKWDMDKLMSHLTVFTEPQMISAMSPTFKEMCFQIGKVLTVSRCTREELNMAIDYINNNADSQRLLVALKHWPSGKVILDAAVAEQRRHISISDNIEAFTEQAPVAEALVAKAQAAMHGEMDTFYPEFFVLAAKIETLLKNTSSEYKRGLANAVTRMMAAVTAIFDAVLPDMSIKVGELLADFGASAKGMKHIDDFDNDKCPLKPWEDAVNYLDKAGTKQNTYFEYVWF